MVTIFDNKWEPIITGWMDNNVPKLWNIYLLPNEYDSPGRNRAEQTMLGAYISYDLPSVAALVRHFHAAVGYQSRSTWLNTIKADNYVS